MLKCTQLDERKGRQRAFSGGLTLEQKGSCRRQSALSLLSQIYLNEPSPDESVKAHSSSRGFTLTVVTEFSEKIITHMQQADTSAQCRRLLTMKFLRGGHSSG